MQLLLFYGRLHHRRFLGFTDEAIEILKSYSWPGNVRELRNVIERAAILCQIGSGGIRTPSGKIACLGNLSKDRRSGLP